MAWARFMRWRWGMRDRFCRHHHDGFEERNLGRKKNGRLSNEGYTGRVFNRKSPTSAPGRLPRNQFAWELVHDLRRVVGGDDHIADYGACHAGHEQVGMKLEQHSGLDFHKGVLFGLPERVVIRLWKRRARDRIFVGMAESMSRAEPKYGLGFRIVAMQNRVKCGVDVVKIAAGA